VGARVRDRRILLGLTQQQLAELIGVTYQQAHKYERCINRVSAGRLYTIARALGVQVSYFYEGLLNEGGPAPSPNQRMLLELARNFLEIRDRTQQEAVVSLARALAETERRVINCLTGYTCVVAMEGPIAMRNTFKARRRRGWVS
jgi:transcriptional regulator with XRE-family HTH domain